MAKLSSDGKYVVVEKGDTLSGIASRYGNGKTYKQLAAINGIPDPNKIYIGQKIYLSKTGSSSTKPKTDSKRVTINQFGLQADVDKTLFATWSWSKKSDTEKYKIQWMYYTKDKVWFYGKNTDTTYMYSTYQIPDNATCVRFRVKPVAKTDKKKDKEVPRFSSSSVDWTDWDKCKFYTKNLPPEAPSQPSVEPDGLKLKASINGVASGVDQIIFQLIKNNTTSGAVTSKPVSVKTSYASYTFTLAAGNTYKVRCKAVKDGLESEWSGYSSDVETQPPAPKGIITLKAVSETEVYIDWENVKNAASYDVEWKTKKSYFDSNPDDGGSKNIDAVVGHAEITGLEAGKEYFFRVRAVGKSGEKSAWCEIKSIKIGKEPSAPTTWSSTTTVISGETLNLYWLHNSEDASNQQAARLRLIVPGYGATKTVYHKVTHETSYHKLINTDNGYTIDREIVALEGVVVEDTYTTDGLQVYTGTLNGEEIYFCMQHHDYVVDMEIKALEGTLVEDAYTEDGLQVYTGILDGEEIFFCTKKVYLGTVYNLSGSGVYRINAAGTLTKVESFKEDEYKTNRCEIITAGYTEGAQIQWQVQTKGIINTGGPDEDGYSEWSVLRTVDVYAQPSLRLHLQNLDGENISLIESFPFRVYGLVNPTTQMPISCHLNVVANEGYETTDFIGNEIYINEGDSVYSKFFDIKDALLVTNDGYKILIEMSANNVDLQNGISYTVLCTVSMDSGLTADASCEFRVSWEEGEFSPNADIEVHPDDYTAVIHPYCKEITVDYHKVDTIYGKYVVTDEIIDNSLYGSEVSGALTETGEQVYFGTTDEGEELHYCEVINSTLVDDVSLSVYRRDFDGNFTEIATGLENTESTYVPDPHPALDYARYRIVATEKSTGKIRYYDTSEVVNGIAVIIQWDEDYSEFTTYNIDDELYEPYWSGMLLKLPCNVDVSDKTSPDVSLVKYIGRKRPVAYYGTQLGETSSWSCVIEKSDEETLSLLRLLSTWMDNVYAREPSGSGYWANIKVSFSQTHNELKIPVSFDITRVEGGK